MGFRSTVVSEDRALIKWPAWFVEKYSPILHFNADHMGAFASTLEAKSYGRLSALAQDVQNAMDWTERSGKRFVFVFLHECGGITRCAITPTAIRWSEPELWQETDGVTHEYCYGCADLPDAPVRPLAE